MDALMSKSNVFSLTLIFLIASCSSSSELNVRADNNDKAKVYYESIGQPQVAEQISKNAQGKNKNAYLVDAVFSGTAALIKGEEISSKCEQGHVDDRVNCRKKNQAQIDALNKSIKKHTDK